MRIGLNGLFWEQEFTGSGQYTRNLWYALPEIEEENEEPPQYVLLGDGRKFAGVAEEAQAQKNPPDVLAKAGAKARKVWWEQAGLPSLANRARKAGQPFTLVHYPYFAAPLFLPKGPTSVVVTIHDLIPLVLPEYSTGTAARAYFRLVSLAARKADLILADSEYSKKDILRLLKVTPSKVQVVYLGVDERYQPGKLPEEERRVLLQKYGLQGHERVIFYLGGYDVRKNVPLIIETFGKALPRLKEAEERDDGGPWTLVLGGKPHTDNPAMYPDLKEPVRRAVGAGPEANRIHFTGRIDEEDKPLMYRLADIYLFPSRYEGFGLDPLEALASGTPTLCSDATSLPEVVGDGGRLISPDNPEGWQAAIEELAARPEARASLASLGPEQAKKFTWQKTARRTLELYRMLECIQTRGH